MAEDRGGERRGRERGGEEEEGSRRRKQFNHSLFLLFSKSQDMSRERQKAEKKRSLPSQGGAQDEFPTVKVTHFPGCLLRFPSLLTAGCPLALSPPSLLTVGRRDDSLTLLDPHLNDGVHREGEEGLGFVKDAEHRECHKRLLRIHGVVLCHQGVDSKHNQRHLLRHKGGTEPAARFGWAEPTEVSLRSMRCDAAGTRSPPQARPLPTLWHLQ